MTTEMIFDGFANAGNFSKGAVIRSKPTDADPFGLGARVEVQTMSCGNVSRKGVFTHPPYRDGCAGDTFAAYQLELPKVRDIVLTGFVGKKLPLASELAGVQ